MRTFLNIIWHIPFLGFVFAFWYALLGLLWCITIIGIPLGIGFFQLARFFLAPFSYGMVSKEDLALVTNEQQNNVVKTYSIIVRIIYFPFGLLNALSCIALIIGECLSIIGIPYGIVWAKSLSTIFNPINKVCVPKTLAEEIKKIKSGNTFKIGGAHPNANKLSAGQKIQNVPLPKQAVVLLAQHLGAPATPAVEKGTEVKVGQLIATASGFISANVHSPVSGKVAKIDTIVDGWGLKTPAVFIDVEGDEWLDTIDRSDKLNTICKLEPAEIVKKVGEAGIVGLGGACFPTHVKLAPPPGKKAEVLIVNAVECEPYLTCDHQLMMEHGEEIMVGVSIIMRAIGVTKAIIGIESNKQDAIKHMMELASKVMGVEVLPLKLKYPQGGEKQLIDACIHRQVPSGALPIEVGAVVQNVATVYAVYEAVQKNKPLIERIVTVTGKSVAKPGNFRVRFGTPLNDILAMAGGIPENTGKIIAGGPMMGRAMSNTDMPANKRISGLLLMPQEESKRKEPQNCIRCAKCVSVCPMGLEPYMLAKQAGLGLWDEMEATHVMDCIECGCCLFTCPSNRPLLDYIRMGKNKVGGIIRARNMKK